MSRKADLGKKGEEIAVKYLEKSGYKVLEQNFRKRYGEIDIIAQDKDTLVFVEVKTRFSEKYGPPEEAVTPRKLKQIAKTGQFYKLLYPELPDLLRIDVLAVDFDFRGEFKEIRLIKNAYMAGVS